MLCSAIVIALTLTPNLKTLPQMYCSVDYNQNYEYV